MTVTSRKVKLSDFCSLLLAVDFYYTMSRFFLQIASRYESRERFRDTSKHK